MLFSVDSFFILVHKCIVFHGTLEKGEVRQDMRVRVCSKDNAFEGEVGFIERDRKLIENAEAVSQPGLGLRNFDVDYANELLTMSPDEDEQKELPPLIELLRLSKPITIVEA